MVLILYDINIGGFIKLVVGLKIFGFGVCFLDNYKGIDIVVLGMVLIIVVVDGVVICLELLFSYGNVVYLFYCINGKIYMIVYVYMNSCFVLNG